MNSTGIDADPYLGYCRAELGAKSNLPLEGMALLLRIGLDGVAAECERAGLTVLWEQSMKTLPALAIDCD